MSSFYMLEQPRADTPGDREGRSDALKEENAKRGPAAHCPRCGRCISLLKWLPPYRIELESWGRHYADVMPIGNELIVSERFRDAFAQAGLRGLSGWEPVEVIKVNRRRRPQEPMPRYYYAPVSRSRTTVDESASGYVWKDPENKCPECIFGSAKLLRYDGVVIDEATWAGEDVFYPRGGNGPIVSERFKTFVENGNFYGMSFVPAETYGFDGMQYAYYKNPAE